MKRLIPYASWKGLSAASMLLAVRGSLTNKRGICACRVLQRDVRNREGGPSRRMSFQELSDRRSGKYREKRAETGALAGEAEQYVTMEYEDELRGEGEKLISKAMMAALRLTNPAAALEKLDVDIGNNQRKSLVQMAQVVRQGAQEIYIIPLSSAHSSALLQRLSRVDRSYSVSKEDQKIKVVVPPMSRERREGTIAEVHNVESEIPLRVKAVRVRAVRYLQQLGLPDAVLQAHIRDVDDRTKHVEEEIVASVREVERDIVNLATATDSDV